MSKRLQNRLARHKVIQLILALAEIVTLIITLMQQVTVSVIGKFLKKRIAPQRAKKFAPATTAIIPKAEKLKHKATITMQL
jgi:hypothetical protein